MLIEPTHEAETIWVHNINKVAEGILSCSWQFLVYRS